MNRYSASCTLRNRKGKSIGGRNPLWEGGAEDMQGALAKAHEALPPILTPEVDTISLFVKGPNGQTLASTEYAEDFTIGYGASAIGSTGLAHDQLDINLTDEQKAEAEELFRQRAINALPEDAKRKLVEEGKAKEVAVEADPFEKRRHIDSPTKSPPSGSTEDASTEQGSSPSASPTQGSTSSKSRSTGKTSTGTKPSPSSSRGATGCGTTSGRSIADLAKLDPNYDVLGKIREAVEGFMRGTGRRVQEVFLSVEAARILARQMNLPAGHAPTHGMIYGYPYMVRQGQTEPIQIGAAPRYASGGPFYGKSYVQTIIDEIGGSGAMPIQKAQRVYMKECSWDFSGIEARAIIDASIKQSSRALWERVTKALYDDNDNGEPT